MQLKPNRDKHLVIDVQGKRYARFPVKTKLITPADKDMALIVEQYAKPHVQPGDILFISEKAVAVTQGRSYHIDDVKASWLATKLSHYVMRTPVGIGLGSPQTMQLAIEEVGILRILAAAVVGGLGKIFGLRGLFYVVAGSGARSIDGAVAYAIPPYNHYVSKGPEKADQVARKIAAKLNIKTAIVDANDLGVNILGVSSGVDAKFVTRAIRDNPLGQSDEQTPIGIIREVLPHAPVTGIRKAHPEDVQKISEIINMLHIDIPNFVWNQPVYIARQIQQGEYFLIEDRGVITGAMSMRQRDKKMHIETLVVRKEFQSKGIGTAFIEFAKNLSKQQGLGRLHAYSFLEYNMANFYLKKGFAKLEHLGYYHGSPYQCFELELS